MEFRILSHACLLVKTERHSIVVDPWLIGSCYWRSWWNFPRAVYDEQELLDVDAVVISHIHWDHWHGPSLKRLFSGKKVIVPDEPSPRSRRDLNSIGFKDVCAVPHAKTVTVGDIKITLYQFGLFLNDAAVVIEAGGVTLLNANDAKIAGLSLQNLLARHGAIDFAFRSHSSANPRICFDVSDKAGNYVPDDRDHYFRSFIAFMDVVKPRHAIPFASNHCHLHPDVFELNSYISNPIELREYVAATGRQHAWRIHVMLPGSRWSEQNSFQLSEETPFRDLPASLETYRRRVAPTLDAYARQENKVVVGAATLRRFLAMLATRPGGWPTPLRFALTLRWPDGRHESWEFQPAGARSEPMKTINEPRPGLPLMVMPAIIFRDAVLLNMFHHAGISKRCRFLASDKRDLDTLWSVFKHLERVEFGVLPLKWGYMRALVRAYAQRWRELVVYGQAFWLIKVRRQPEYLAEETILGVSGK